MIHWLKPLKQLLFFLVYSNLFIAACAVLMAQHSSLVLLNDYASPEMVKFIFFSTLCSYSFHYYFTTPSAVASERNNWTRKNKILIILLFVTGLAGSVYWLFHLWDYKFWLIPAVVATFLYSAPKIPHPLFRLLKKIAIGKTIFLAFIWMYVTTILPLVVSDTAWNNTATLYIVSRYFFIYSICILFDFRDKEDDKINGVKSLVTFLDKKNIVRLFLFSLLIYFIFTLLLRGHQIQELDIIFLLLPGIILLFLYKPSMRNFSDLLYYLVLDGLMALSAAMTLISRI